MGGTCHGCIAVVGLGGVSGPERLNRERQHLQAATRGAGHEIHAPGATGSLKMGSRLWPDCVSGLRTYPCQMASATSRGNGLRGSLAMLWNYFARRLRRAATPSTPKFDFCSPRDRATSPPLSRSFAAPPSSLPSTNLTSLHAAAGDINSTLSSSIQIHSA
ncbi:hypothetical protein C8J57DRAFT_1237129 [Mycena rebaudengoi]|nr:hypothetical protein C8J57DRAFT_1237129 [Mycena rebaudengoi]